MAVAAKHIIALRPSKEKNVMFMQSHIREAMQGVSEYYTQNPDQALSQDKEDVSVIDERLRVRATGPNGQSLACDMPQTLGGGGSTPSPTWTACWRSTSARALPPNRTTRSPSRRQRKVSVAYSTAWRSAVWHRASSTISPSLTGR